MEALEEYYQEYLMGYAQDSNFSSYDVDAQLTKDRIEQILEVGYMTEDDVEFIKSIIPDIENERIRAVFLFIPLLITPNLHPKPSSQQSLRVRQKRPSVCCPERILG